MNLSSMHALELPYPKISVKTYYMKEMTVNCELVYAEVTGLTFNDCRTHRLTIESRTFSHNVYIYIDRHNIYMSIKRT